MHLFVSDIFGIAISPFQAHGKAQFLEASCLIKYLMFQVSKNLMFLKQLLKSLASQCVILGLGR